MQTSFEIFMCSSTDFNLNKYWSLKKATIAVCVIFLPESYKFKVAIYMKIIHKSSFTQG